jgi:teichuronic acid exporter
MSIYKKIVKGSIWGLIGSAGYQLSGLIVFIILSRILSPVDFGTAALAIVFVELTRIFVRYGLVEVTVRSSESKLGSVENDVFMTTLILGIITSLLFLVTAPYLEFIFDAPGLAISLQILSVAPILQSLSTVPEAILRRDFKFKSLAIRLLCSSTIAGIIAIYLAYNDFGFYSLIIQKILSTSLALLLVWREITWRPTLKISYFNFKHTLQQGHPILVSALIGQSIFRFVELIIGFFLGVVALGYFKIAGKLLDVIVQFTLKPIVDVSFSAFTKLKNEPVELEKCYVNFVKVCSIFSFPAFVGTYIVGSQTVILLFGEKWVNSGLILQIFCIGGMSSTLNYFFSPLCHATNNSHIPFKIRIVEFCVTMFFVFIASQHSIYYVAMANVLVAALITSTMLIVLSKLFFFKMSHLFDIIMPSLISSILMGATVYIAQQFVSQEMAPIINIFWQVVLGGISYALFYRVLFPKETADIFIDIKKLRV